jgi:uncharacterized protein YjbI with pentapeptide repeats
MAHEEHLAKLREGAEAWNRWRKEHADIFPDLSDANLRRTDLTGADLNRADLRESDLSEANLSHANLSTTDLTGADLSDVNLSDANLSQAFLIEAFLIGANLSGANLGAADLAQANLGGVNLSAANLVRANLNGANLLRTNLSDANLTEADLSGTELSGAKLHWSNFSLANLNKVNIHEVRLSETIWGGTNLREAKGLDTCIHEGPSILDFLTLAYSGPLPLPFLRGCGLPDVLIEYLPSLLNQPIQFYSCFISYSTKDQEFAERLHADLQNKGVRCWFAVHDIQSGKKIHQQIDEAIRRYDRLLLILSGHSMKSEWVMTEISKARKREVRERRRVLFPLRLVDFETLRNWEFFDADIGKDSAQEIREYFVPDFSNWKDHDSYQKAFDRLLKDLKAEGERADTETAVRIEGEG